MTLNKGSTSEYFCTFRYCRDLYFKQIVRTVHVTRFSISFFLHWKMRHFSTINILCGGFFLLLFYLLFFIVFFFCMFCFCWVFCFLYFFSYFLGVLSTNFKQKKLIIRVLFGRALSMFIFDMYLYLTVPTISPR